MCIISNNIKKVADYYRDAGYSIDINNRIPYLAINDKTNDSEFFMQGDEVDSFLTEADDLASEFDTSRDDAIFYLIDQAGVLE